VPELLVALFLLLVAGAFWLYRRGRRRALVLERVSIEVSEEGELLRSRQIESILNRRPWVSPLLAVLAALVMRLGFGMAFWLAVAFAFVFGAVVWIVEEFLYGRKELRVEEQVADAIDILVSALRAGTGLVDAMTIAANEARRPMKKVLEEIVNRLRLGDDPETVFRDFARRVPLESAELLAFTLSVHWNVGGSLAPALASVGQGTRHRIEFSRRVRSQATEGRASVVGMLAITYLLALLMWKAYPERFDVFFASGIGIGLTAAVVILEGIGLVWMSLLTRIRS
jgi:Flp pilus assembly protein TadB